MAMLATIYERVTWSRCGASPTCLTTSSFMCGPYLKLSTYPPQAPNHKMGVHLVLPQYPPPLQHWGGVEGSVHVVDYVEVYVEVDQLPHLPPSPRGPLCMIHKQVLHCFGQMPTT